MKARLFALMAPLLCAPLFATPAHAKDAPFHLDAPAGRPIKVAFILSDGAVPIDFTGPWEVFENVHLPAAAGMDMEARMPFELYTVAPSTAVIHTAGNHHAGMAITPDYDFASAPEPDVVVLPAQDGGPGLSAWLQKLHADHKVIVSVCTGAFRLAESGLLDGKEATTHHGAYDALAGKFPNVKVVRSVRYVQSDPTTFTSGGLSAGIDLALHIVDGYYGRSVTQQVADVMEYRGTDWKK